MSAVAVHTITIIGGRDKNGMPEEQELELRAGDVAVVVGPTGSGKSRLLADIEYLAQGDTPSGRRILLNGKAPDPEERFGVGSKLIAQLSQNMNFVLDATVGEFLCMHGACMEHLDRSEQALQLLAVQVLEQANRLAGEAFTLETPLTSLSGGQSRALMIADTAILSDAPIVLIDEIENAGIDKRLALDILIDRQKIVLMATHDPILALSGHYRLVLGNGALRRVLRTSPAELALLARLRTADRQLADIRQLLRAGERLDGAAAWS